jgi:hypothetical protein
MNLRLDEICLDPELQIRKNLDMDTIAEYAYAMQEGAKFPPIKVFDDGQKKYLVNGWHRWHGSKQAGFATIEVEIIKGTKRDALEYACGANHDNGLPRTNEDKRRAVMVMFNDIEWSERTDNEIAKVCKVSNPFVAKIRKELGADNDRRVRKDGTRVKVNEPKKVQQPEEDPQELRLQELADALLQANEEKTALEDRLALKVVEAAPEEKERLGETLADLRKQVKLLEIENNGLKASLQTALEEKNQLIRQVNYWKKQATKGST